MLQRDHIISRIYLKNWRDKKANEGCSGYYDIVTKNWVTLYDDRFTQVDHDQLFPRDNSYRNIRKVFEKKSKDSPEDIDSIVKKLDSKIPTDNLDFNIIMTMFSTFLSMQDFQDQDDLENTEDLLIELMESTIKKVTSSDKESSVMFSFLIDHFPIDVVRKKLRVNSIYPNMIENSLRSKRKDVYSNARNCLYVSNRPVVTSSNEMMLALSPKHLLRLSSSEIELDQSSITKMFFKYNCVQKQNSICLSPFSRT